MKKLVSIILMLVVMMMVMSAMAETKDGIVYGINYSDVQDIIKEWAESKNLSDWIEMNDIDGVLYGLGGVCKDEFESSTGEQFTIEKFDKWSAEQFNIDEINTYVMDVYNGIKIYHSTAASETTALGWKSETNFYKADVIFFVFSVNDYEE